MANRKPFRTKEPSRARFLKDPGDGTYPCVGEAVLHVTRSQELYDGEGKRYGTPQFQWRVEVSIVNKEGRQVGIAYVPFDGLLRQMRDASE